MYRVLNVPWPCGHVHHALGQKRPPPPGVCCQRTPDGGVICSNGVGYPPG